MNQEQEAFAKWLMNKTLLKGLVIERKPDQKI